MWFIHLRIAVKLHNLSGVLPLLETTNKVAKPEVQLQLFNVDIFDTRSSDNTATNYASLEDSVELAYQLQGEQIAYVERNKNTDAAHNRAS